MGISWYLAMTAAEISGCAETEKPAFMACHFSHAGSGLTNLPRHLPSDSLVILDDSVPFDNHDPVRIADQLCQIPCMSSLLLDFQRPVNKTLISWIDKLCHALSFPVAVTEAYAKETACAVFLSSPLNIPIWDAVKRWQGRELWLDIPFGSQRFTVTRAGCETEPILPAGESALPLWDEDLQCSYQIDIQADRVFFTLQRRAGAATTLLQQADSLGIQKAISLRQEYLSNP